MKIKNKILLVSLILVIPMMLTASDKHGDHDHHHHKKLAGPNGGKLITSVEPHLELLILGNKKAQITFFDHEMNPVPHKDQFVALVGGSKKNPVQIHFEKSDGKLLSKQTLPIKKHPLPAVLMIKKTKNTKPKYEQFYINLNPCSNCNYKEYACTCDH